MMTDLESKTAQYRVSSGFVLVTAIWLLSSPIALAERKLLNVITLPQTSVYGEAYPDAGGTFATSIAAAGDYLVIGTHASSSVFMDTAPHAVSFIYEAASGEMLHQIDGNSEPFMGDPGQFRKFRSQVATNGQYAVVAEQQVDVRIAIPPRATILGAMEISVYDLVTGERLRQLPIVGHQGLSISQYNVFPSGFDDLIAMDNNRIVVGVPTDNDNGNNSGAAYVLNVNTGEQMARLTPSSPSEDDYFGTAVAIDEDHVLVGASSPTGAYHFDLSNGTELNLSANRNISTVAMEGDIAVVSGGGRHEVFDTLTTDLRLAFSPTTECGDEHSVFSAATDGQTIYGGTLNTSVCESGSDWGSVYLIDGQSGDMSRIGAERYPASQRAQFGFDIAVSGPRLFVAAPLHRNPLEGGETGVRGSVYVFSRLDGDLDGDGDHDVRDIDLLSTAMWTGTFEARYDFDGDGVLTQTDRAFWLEELAETFFGDANLDGMVDEVDLNVVGTNWQRTDATTLANGDFDGDGRVDVMDLNLLGINWQRRASGETAVPEPTSTTLLLLISFVVLVGRMRSNFVWYQFIQTPPA